METTPISAETIPVPKKKTNYPEPYASLVEGRSKRKLGNFFGLSNFGANLTKLSSGAISALFHQHEKQDEFVYILEGTPTLISPSHITTAFTDRRVLTLVDAGNAVKFSL